MKNRMRRMEKITEKEALRKHNCQSRTLNLCFSKGPSQNCIYPYKRNTNGNYEVVLYPPSHVYFLLLHPENAKKIFDLCEFMWVEVQNIMNKKPIIASVKQNKGQHPTQRQN